MQKLGLAIPRDPILDKFVFDLGIISVQTVPFGKYYSEKLDTDDNIVFIKNTEMCGGSQVTSSPA